MKAVLKDYSNVDWVSLSMLPVNVLAEVVRWSDGGGDYIGLIIIKGRETVYEIGGGANYWPNILKEARLCDKIIVRPLKAGEEITVVEE